MRERGHSTVVRREERLLDIAAAMMHNADYGRVRIDRMMSSRTGPVSVDVRSGRVVMLLP